MNSRTKQVAFFAILIGVAVLFWAVLQNEPNRAKATYSQFLQQVQAGQVSNATIVAAHTGADNVTYSLKDGRHLQTVVPSDYRSVLEIMQQKLVNIEIRDDSSQSLRVLGNASPFLILLGFWLFAMGRLQNKHS